MRRRTVAVDPARLLLAHQPTIRQEHRIEVESSEKGVVSHVEADENTQLDDLGVGVVDPESLVERLVDALRGELHQLTELKSHLFAFGELRALTKVVHALVDAFLSQTVPLRRSGSNVPSVVALSGARQLDANDLLERVVDRPGVENGSPRNVQRRRQRGVVALNRMEGRIGSPMLQALLHKTGEARIHELFDLEHRDVRHCWYLSC